MAEVKTMDDYDVVATRVVRHGLFWYYVPEETVQNGEEKVILVQHTAFAGEPIDLWLKSDLERAEKHGALHDQEESDRRIAGTQVTIPEPGADDDDVDEVELSSLDSEELVNWLMSTGEFDGNKKPSAPEVVMAVGGDAELAQRVIDAEGTASGGDQRQGVVKPLQAIIDKATAPA